MTLRSAPAHILLLALVALAISAVAAPVQQPHSQAELIAERSAVTPGQPLTLALRLRLEDGWHVYWKNPGDSGMATSIAWTLPSGFGPGPMQWPAPMRIDTGPLTSYGYEREVVHLVDVAVPAGLSPGTSVPVRAHAEWLVCKEICLPASADLALDLPVSNAAAAPDPDRAAQFAAARAALPAAPAQAGVAAYRSGDSIVLRVPASAAPGLRQLSFFPDREGLIQYAQPQIVTRHAEGIDLRLIAAGPSDSTSLAGVLVGDAPLGGAPAIEVQLPVLPGPPPAVAAAPATTSIALLGAIALAFAGGLLLNLMPCVFPVLAIKALGLAQQAQGRAATMRAHGLLFAAGVVTSFWLLAGLLLALRAQGSALGWGYQLQSPAVVAALAVLFFVLALNLSGVFHFGARLQGLAARVGARNLHLDAFLSGMLVTAIASPCTAPFMGAALGYALVQPAQDALPVFTALAAGVALPYVVLTFVPGLARRLPRPGAWMETLRQLLAFPLYATVVWLLWVLGQQSGADAIARMLFALLLVAAALWALGRAAPRRPVTRVAVRLVALALCAGALGLVLSGAQPAKAKMVAAQADWQPWSDAAVGSALAQDRAVFVDFTAAWCVTCQVNKRLVLQADEVERRFNELRVVRLRADWTNRDPAITSALARLDRSGVPVYALYLPPAREPQLLPEVLTRRLVLDALARVGPLAAAPSSPANTKEQP